MLYKLIPLEIDPVVFETTRNEDHWKAQARDFFIVEPAEDSQNPEEMQRELRCTLDLLLTLHGKTFYDANEFSRVAHRNLAGSPQGPLADELGPDFYVDYGTASSPGGLSFVNMILDSGLDISGIGTIHDQRPAKILALALYINPLWWPMLKFPSMRYPRLDIILDRILNPAVVEPMRRSIAQIAELYLSLDYSAYGGLEIEATADLEGQGQVLQLPPSLLPQEASGRYDYQITR